MRTADLYTQAYRELSQEVHDAGLIQRRYWFFLDHDSRLGTSSRDIDRLGFPIR